MSRFSKTELVIFAVAAVLISVAVLFFAGVISPGKKERTPVTVWGSLPASWMENALSAINADRSQQTVSIAYAEHAASAIESDLLNAVARGDGPDVWLITHTFVAKHADKIIPLGAQFISPRAFRETFIDGASLVARGESALAVPLIADPLVLYWNRDLFRNAGLTNAPATWDEFLTFSRRLTQPGANQTFRVSGAALGEANNVPHAKNILALLVLQTGNPVVDSATRRVTLMQQGSALLGPGESALRFFTDFSNPDNAAYAWNSAQPQADAAFVAGKLAMYIGQASEYRSLREQNPHLALDVAQIPQIRDGAISATYADMFGFAILQSSKNPQAAWQAILLLTNQAAAASVSGQSGLPPMRKDLLRRDPADPVQSVFWRAAIQSRAWLDPRPDIAASLFADAVRAVNSGAKSVNRAASDLVSQLQQLY